MQASTQVRTVTAADVLDELRGSCRRRAQRDALVDEAGIVGVIEGAAPLLWVDHAASADRVVELAEGAPSLSEIYVRDGRDDVVLALRARGWRVTVEHQHMVCAAPADQPAPPSAAVTIRETDDPSLMPTIRQLIIDSFGLPAHIVAASYPDDFFVRAAPARLLVAEDAEGRIVGVIGRRRQGRSAMLFAVAVAADRRGHGLGAALVHAATTAALGDGAEFVHATLVGGGQPLAHDCGFRSALTWLRLERELTVGR